MNFYLTLIDIVEQDFDFGNINQEKLDYLLFGIENKLLFHFQYIYF